MSSAWSSYPHVVQAQAWYRDPPSPNTTHLSNALEFTLVP